MAIDPVGPNSRHLVGRPEEFFGFRLDALFGVDIRTNALDFGLQNRNIFVERIDRHRGQVARQCYLGWAGSRAVFVVRNHGGWSYR